MPSHNFAQYRARQVPEQTSQTETRQHWHCKGWILTHEEGWIPLAWILFFQFTLFLSDKPIVEGEIRMEQCGQKEQGQPTTTTPAGFNRAVQWRRKRDRNLNSPVVTLLTREQKSHHHQPWSPQKVSVSAANSSYFPQHQSELVDGSRIWLTHPTNLVNLVLNPRRLQMHCPQLHDV